MPEERREMNVRTAEPHSEEAPELMFLPPEMLKPTEEIIPSHLRELTAQMLASSQWQTPILVERSTLIIMDGHHRRAFALEQKFARVPCILLSYSHVLLESRRKDLLVTPAEVISRGLKGKLYPPKSTRHTLQTGGELIIEFPLQELLGPFKSSDRLIPSSCKVISS
jgi:hypothetical protein